MAALPPSRNRRFPFLAAALLLAACAEGVEPPATTAPPGSTSSAPSTSLDTTSSAPVAPLPLRIGVTPSIAHGIPFVMAAEDTGIAAANGLAISVEVYDTDNEALAAARAGEADVVLPSALAALAALADGACFVAPLDFIDQDAMRLVGRSDLFTAEDLIEREVGTVAGSAAEVALRMWLRDEGVEWGEVTVVDTRAQDLAAALAGGQVDAVIWTEPVPGAALEACGQEACHYIGDIGASYRDVSLVTVACSWQEADRREGMQRLVRAWLEAREYLRNNLAAAAEITAGRLRLTGEEVEALWLERGWLDAWGANLTDGQLEMVEAYGAYLEAAGALAEAPAPCSWVNSTWLREVAPSLVSLEAYDC